MNKPPYERIDPDDPNWILGGVIREHLARYELAQGRARGQRVLDVACGMGYGSAMLARVAREVVGVDLSEQTIASARQRYTDENIQFICANGAALPFEDGSFDAAVSFETIEHLPEVLIDSFLSELRRVVRPGGWVLISSPHRDSYSFGPVSSNRFHHYEFDTPDFESRLGRYFEIRAMLGQKFSRTWFLNAWRALARGPVFGVVSRLWRVYQMVLRRRGDVTPAPDHPHQTPLYLIADLRVR